MFLEDLQQSRELKAVDWRIGGSDRPLEVEETGAARLKA
jgi:hypothetical protein